MDARLLDLLVEALEPELDLELDCPAADVLGVERLSHRRLLQRGIRMVREQVNRTRAIMDAQQRLGLRKDMVDDIKHLLRAAQGIQAHYWHYAALDGQAHLLWQKGELYDLMDRVVPDLVKLGTQLLRLVESGAIPDHLPEATEAGAGRVMVTGLAELYFVMTGKEPAVGSERNPGGFVEFAQKAGAPFGWRTIVRHLKWDRLPSTRTERLLEIIPSLFTLTPEVEAHIADNP